MRGSSAERRGPRPENRTPGGPTVEAKRSPLASDLPSSKEVAGPSPASPRPERRDADEFDLPVQRIRAGHYSDRYFVRAREILEAEGRDPVVTMQFFQKRDAVLAGTDEALAILRRCLSHGFDWKHLEVRALREGDRLEPREPALEITGPYRAFGHLETLLVGVLGRCTGVASRTREVVEAAGGKPVLFFPARHDHWAVQPGDGWAARVGGATAVSTDAQASSWGGEGVGTIPHALIAAFGGDTVAATQAFARHLPDDVRVTALVDFDNDSVGTSLAVARALGPRLHGVRLDTAETMVDRALLEKMGDEDPRGVNPTLVRSVRDALDHAGFGHVRILCSGGFDAAKVRRFEEARVPVDGYGVGSSLLRGGFNFTADVVLLEGRPAAKAGRRHRPNPRLTPVH
ncbi:MAG: nicotinate phosphoribosyltransferase [Gemmatimonadales bacterium]|nr:MAG: nicotinate phosphoribosyltransferase [Gemmatimonadales bacterium]